MYGRISTRKPEPLKDLPETTGEEIALVIWFSQSSTAGELSTGTLISQWWMNSSLPIPSTLAQRQGWRGLPKLSSLRLPNTHIWTFGHLYSCCCLNVGSVGKQSLGSVQVHGVPCGRGESHEQSPGTQEAACAHGNYNDEVGGG